MNKVKSLNWQIHTSELQKKMKILRHRRKLHIIASGHVICDKCLFEHICVTKVRLLFYAVPLLRIVYLFHTEPREIILNIRLFEVPRLILRWANKVIDDCSTGLNFLVKIRWSITFFSLTGPGPWSSNFLRNTMLIINCFSYCLFKYMRQNAILVIISKSLS